MKYDPGKSFGYPVLTTQSDDYIKSDFQTEIDFDINPEDPKQFHVDFMFSCSVKEIRDLIKDDAAAYCIKISCRSTFYSTMYEVKAAGELS